jgi:hypothetical protein
LELAPWEVERRDRIRKLLVASALHLAALPSWQLPEPDLRSNRKYWRPIQAGTDLPGSPARVLTVEHWNRVMPPLTSMNRLVNDVLSWCQQRAEHLHDLRLLQLVTAEMLYKIDHERSATELSELVPKYLASIPVNPRTGKEFTFKELTAAKQKWKQD